MQLTNGQTARPSITLGLATVAENVTVTGQSPLLQTSNASVSQTITQKQIEDLPVAGRNLLAFAALSAGVTPQSFNRGTQFGAAGSSRSQFVTVEGGRDSSTNYAIDGVYVRSLRFNNISLNPPLDAVQEVNVLRNAQRITGESRIAGFIGGCHLTGGIFEAIIEPTVEAFSAANVARVLPAHCTGWKAVHLLARAMPSAFVQPAVGTVVSF